MNDGLLKTTTQRIIAITAVAIPFIIIELAYLMETSIDVLMDGDEAQVLGGAATLICLLIAIWSYFTLTHARLQREPARVPVRINK